MNWLDQLQQFRDSNPDLPEGPDIPVSDEGTATPAQKSRLDIIMERKGRGGKTATIISGWDIPADAILEIAASIKKKLGAGGSARGGDILIQGDRRKDILALLTSMGYKARII